MQVTVISPEKLILDTTAISISGNNQNGKFDILDNHAHLISLFHGELKISTQKENITYNASTGIIRCWDNTVQIYITEPKE